MAAIHIVTYIDGSQEAFQVQADADAALTEASVRKSTCSLTARDQSQFDKGPGSHVLGKGKSLANDAWASRSAGQDDGSWAWVAAPGRTGLMAYRAAS